MKNIKYKLSLLSLFALISMSCSSSPVIKDKDNQVDLTDIRSNINAQKLLEEQSTPQLTNSQGLSIHIKPRLNSGLVSLQLWMMVGTGDEKDDEKGAAYALQTYLLGQPENPKSLAGKISKLGGKASAWTSIDRSVFEITVLPEHINETIEAMSDMIALKNDDQGFQTALEVLIENQGKAKQWLNKQALERLLYQVFQGHRNGNPSLPYPEDIKKLNYGSIKAFHQKHYYPNRAHLIVVGQVKESDIIPPIQKYWGNWTGKAQEKEWQSTNLENQSTANLQIDALQQLKSQIYVAFPIDQVTPEGAAYLDLIALLFTGDSDRLLYRAARQAGLDLSKARVFPFIPDGPGVLIFHLEVPSHQVELAWRVLLEQINNMRFRPPMFRDMEQAKMIFERDTIKNGESFATQARRIGFFSTRWANTEGLLRYSRAIYQVRPEDLAAFTRDIFKYQSLNALIQANLSKQASVNDWQQQLLAQAKSILNQESLIKKPGVWQLDDRLKVIYHPMKNEGVISLKAVLPFTKHLHSSYDLALAHWVSSLASLQQKYEPEFQSDIHLGALHLESTITVGELDEAIAALMRRLRQPPVRTDPAWSSDSLERARASAQAELQLKRHRPLDKLSFLFQRAQLAQKAPAPAGYYARAEELESLSASDLMNWYKGYIQNRPILLTITGDINRSELGMALTPYMQRNQQVEQFGELQQASDRLVLDMNTMESPTLNQCRYILETIDHDRAWMLLGFSLENLQPKDELSLKLVESFLLDPQGDFQLALLQRKIPSKIKAFDSQEGDHPFMGIYIEIENEFQSEVILAFQAAIQKLKESGIPQAQLQRIKDQLIARQRIELTSCAAKADFISLLYSQGWETIDENITQAWSKAIQELSLAQIQDLIHRILLKKQEITAILSTPMDYPPLNQCQRLTP